MEVAKSFERNGVRYRPGDPMPADLDKDIIAHYLRHGMVREARLPTPAETKPATPARRQRTPQPTKQPDAPKPDETKTATGNGADSPGETSTSDVNATEDKAEQGQAATDGVAGDAPPGAGQEST